MKIEMAQARAPVGNLNQVMKIMKTMHSEVIETVKRQIVAAVKGTGDIVQATADTITQTLPTAIKSSSRVDPSVTAAIADIASGAVHGAAELGADLGQAAKGIMLGVLRCTQGTVAQVLATIRQTAFGAIWDTADVGGDLGTAASGLVAGAIDGAKELGVGAEDAVVAAADGALKAASQVGPTAVSVVRNGLSQPIKAPKITLEEGRWLGPTIEWLNDPDWCGKASHGSVFSTTGSNLK